MRTALLILTLLGGLVWGQDFSKDEYLHSFPDQRLELFPLQWPYLGVTRKSRVADCQGTNPRCTYEWRLPYSTIEASQHVARDLRRAWQRFEERYWWRVQTALNQPSFPLIYCMMGVDMGPLEPPLPKIHVEAQEELFPQNYSLPLPSRSAASKGQHRLDDYVKLGPQVPKEDFCDDLQVDLFPMIIPPFCIELGDLKWCTEGYPDKPLWFNEDRARQYVEAAIQHSFSKYFPEYQLEVLQRLLPKIDLGNGSVWAPLNWEAHLSGQGAILAAVANINPFSIPQSLQEIVNLINDARFSDGLLDTLRLPYYSRSLFSLLKVAPFGDTVSQLCRIIMGCAEGVLEQALRTAGATADLSGLQKPFAPGFWQLEQLKRYFPPSHPIIQEVFGYASFFQIYNKFEVGSIPDPNAEWKDFGEYTIAQGLRTLGYWFVPLRLRTEMNSFPPTVIILPDTPRMHLVPPYILPYAVERTHYSWVSVPEGYLIPRVKGLPGLPNDINYNELFK